MEKDFEYYIEMARKAIPVKKDLNLKTILEKALDKKLEELDSDTETKFVFSVSELDLPSPRILGTLFDAIDSLRAAYKKAGWMLSYDDEFREIHLEKIGKK